MLSYTTIFSWPIFDIKYGDVQCDFSLIVLQDAVQNSGTPAQLKFFFQIPNDSSVKDTIVYELPNTLINPAFYSL